MSLIYKKFDTTINVSANVVRGYDSFNNRAAQGHAFMINSSENGTIYVRYKTQTHWLNTSGYDFQYSFPILSGELNRFALPRYGDSYYLFFDASATPVNVCGNIIETDNFNPTHVYDGHGNVIDSSAGALLVYNVGPAGTVTIDAGSGISTSANQETMIEQLEVIQGDVSGSSGLLTNIQGDVSGSSGLLTTIQSDINDIKAALSLNLDAFARIRVSEPFTLGDYKHVYGIDEHFYDNVSGGGTVAYNISASCCLLSVNGAYSQAIHQTKLYHHYSPGKSQHILSSFRFGAAIPGIRKRTGYYDDYNGIFFEQGADGAIRWTIRNQVDSSGESVVRSNWNIDPCDGTGPSGVSLDFSMTQLIFIDFQWLGVGRVRVGFVHDGAYLYAHDFYHSNVLQYVYMRTPNLPVRCEITNTSSSIISASMDQICSTVVSEGGYIEAGQDWGYITPGSLHALAANASLCIIGLKLDASFHSLPNNMYLRLQNVNIFSTDTNVKYEVVKVSNSSNISGATWSAVNTDSGSVVSNNIASITGGSSSYEAIDNGWVSASQAKGNVPAVAGANGHVGPSAKKNYIARNPFNGVSEAYVIIVTNINSTSSTNVGVGLQWREIY